MAATPRPQQTGTRDAEAALQLFDKIHTAQSWQPWRAWLSAVFGVTPRSDAARELIRECTGRASLPTKPAREAWCIVGRRGGKSKVAALLAVYASCFRQYTLSPGERGRVLIIAADRKQAQVVHQYTAALIEGVPALAARVQRRTADTIDLADQITIEIATADYRSLRGRTIVCAICDEIAFWESDQANTDAEILTALRPAMATVENALLICLSTPYARRGALFAAFDKHWSKDSDKSGVLIWWAPSLAMNPTLDADLIEQARTDDAVVAASEYDAQFRRDLERLFSQAAVQAVTIPGRYELPPMSGASYRAFADPSGGSSDAFALAIAHQDKDGRAILDLVREQQPPFSPEATVSAFAAVLRQYRCVTVSGDRYAGLWPAAEFAKHGIKYVAAAQVRSELYLEALPLINSGRVELLDHPKLHAQLIGLERRTGRSGRDAIDHRQGQHDDVANAAAGALVLCVAAAGALAAWPSDFRECLKAANVSQFNVMCCALLGGPQYPDGDSCFKYCAGWREARPAWRAYQQSDGKLSLREFCKQHFGPNNLSSLVALDRFVRNVWMV